MAQLMMCPGCKTDIAPGSQYCTKGCFLTPVPKPAAQPLEAQPPEAQPLEAPSPEAQPPEARREPAERENLCGDPDCVHGGRPPAAGCRHCGMRGVAAPVLRFPWGRVDVPTDRPLVVGREDSPLAAEIARRPEFGNVSRRHAEISSDASTLTVTDLDSMNGTFVNDQRLAAQQATPLETGDRVRFAARLEATVTGENE